MVITLRNNGWAIIKIAAHFSISMDTLKKHCATELSIGDGNLETTLNGLMMRNASQEANLNASNTAVDMMMRYTLRRSPQGQELLPEYDIEQEQHEAALQSARDKLAPYLAVSNENKRRKETIDAQVVEDTGTPEPPPAISNGVTYLAEPALEHTPEPGADESDEVEDVEAIFAAAQALLDGD